MAQRDIRIVVHQNNWVLVGYYTERNGEIQMSPYAVVRIWGTKRGLPEIADNGPTKETVLDIGVGTFRCKLKTELFTLSCNAAKWAKSI